MSDQIGTQELARRAYETMLENGFAPEFPDEVIGQLQDIDRADTDGSEKSIQDLRSLLWSSIDNRSSRDLDQVEWAESLANGDIRLLVGIADVDELVRKGSPIDDFARQNTVTVYTQGRIFPMLPEKLSTDLTSLNENADRLAIVADMSVKPNGDVPVSTFFRARIQNQAKLAYDEIGDYFEDRSKQPADFNRITGLREQIDLQREVAERLAAYRRKKGALEFESIESAAVVENGEIKGLESVRPNQARKLIENFMVAANVEMAEFLETAGSASLRRIVREPRDWQGIVQIAAGYGESLPSVSDRGALAAFVEKRRQADPDRFPDLSLSIVKLIGSGSYVVERPGEDAGGHFGLAVRDYAHSTAPNRRFSDIVTQRLVKAVISLEPTPYSPVELDEIAVQCNLQEKAARKVERKMRKIVAAGVAKHRIGERFTAIVTGINQGGTFARILRPPVDGRIQRGESGLSVGEKITVKLLSADTRNGFIDFAAAEA